MKKPSKFKQVGAAMVEYALLVALIAVVCVTAMQTLGDKANHKLEHIANQLGDTKTSSSDNS